MSENEGCTLCISVAHSIKQFWKLTRNVGRVSCVCLSAPTRLLPNWRCQYALHKYQVFHLHSPIPQLNPKALHPAPIFICIVKPISTLMRVDLWPLCPYGGSTLAAAPDPVCCLSCHANCLQICLAAVKVLLKIRY